MWEQAGLFLVPRCPTTIAFPPGQFADHFAHRYVASIGLQAKKSRVSGAGTPTQSTASDAVHSKKRS